MNIDPIAYSGGAVRIILQVLWINPNQDIRLYPSVMDGLKVELRKTPLVDYFFLDTEQEARDLKARIEQLVPVHKYRYINESNDQLVDNAGEPVVVQEPDIKVIFT